MDTNQNEKEIKEQTVSADGESGIEKTDGKKKIEFPEFLTVTSSPHIKSPDTTRSIMLDVIIGLIPALIWGVYIFGMRALTITLISVASCVLFEFLTQKLLHRPVTILDFSAAVTGILLAMNLSVAVPLWIPIAGAFFAIVVVKQIFGGIGKNVVNPALAARVFLFAWPGEMTRFVNPKTAIDPVSIGIDADIVAQATPLASLKHGELPNVSIFDMLIGNNAGCIGEVSALLLAAGGVYLLVRKVITWHIPVAFIGTVAVLTFVFPQGGANSLDFMLYEIFAGGLMIGAFFMATDYVTSPVTAKGKLIFGVGCGLITVFIRFFGGYYEGVSFSILIMNLLVWYIDKFTRPVKFGGKSNVKKQAEK